jgi:hypothetical protein
MSNADPLLPGSKLIAQRHCLFFRYCFERLVVAAHPLQPDSLFPTNKMPDVDSYDSSSGIAVDVQQRLNCALP